MTLLNQYQNRIICPSEIVDYASICMQAYPPQAMANEPFIGFKVLCVDKQSYVTNPRDRILQIESSLGFLRGKGCIIRETDMRMPDGFWVITMPTPRSQMSYAIKNLIDVLMILEQHFGIVRQGIVDINVSGRCHIADTERCLGGLVIPTQYQPRIIPPENTAYKLGHITRINDYFMLFRTRWMLKETFNDDLVVMSQIISSMYH